MEEVIEIALTVPYEIEIRSEDINMDNFECFFSVETDYANFNLPLKRKGKDYILKVPQELSVIGNKELHYKILVTQENAIFCASEGKVKVISATKDSFKVNFKAKPTDEGQTTKETPKETAKSDEKPKNETPKVIKPETKRESPKSESVQPIQSIITNASVETPTATMSPEKIASGEAIKREALKEYKRESIHPDRKGGGRTLQEIMEEKARQKEKLQRKDEINARVQQLLGEMKS